MCLCWLLITNVPILCKGDIACQVPIASHCVLCCPSQGAILCHESHRKVPVHAYIAHRKVPVHACIAHRKVPSFGMFPIARCHRVACCPLQCAIVWDVAHRKVPSCGMLPIARCHRVACCPSKGVIVGKIYYVKVPLCGYVTHCVVPWEVLTWLPGVPSFPSEGVVVCLCSPCQGAIVCLYSPCQDAIVCPCCPLRVPLVVPKNVLRMVCAASTKIGYPMIPSCARLPM